MKGIILAGGSGTRLYPLTRVTSKQLLPIYDKPMIYYPLAVLMLGGIRDILIISTPQDLPNFKELLGDGSGFGISLSYKEQPHPEGLAQAFIIGESFVGDDPVCLILGDNLFHGHNLSGIIKNALHVNSGGVVFGYRVNDPKRYGVVEFGEKGNVIGIEEKPENPKSKYAVSGLYVYDNEVIQIAKDLKPSDRGELEITDVNREYLRRDALKVEILGRGFAWMDMGTHESMQQAAGYVRAVQNRQGFKIACIEEIAYRLGYINSDQLKEIAAEMIKNDYGQYLQEISELKPSELFKWM
ncbi:MAG: glucose-1-phosphate thymidylyltransferase RfbA [Desulfobacteraceae bacterium]|jgi:glucose-1-phosphate thymidylyltransferase|nr:glucose-1-phosphate thymidylyltransferase RfbA [Desulfobacteraceae bacterium]